MRTFKQNELERFDLSGSRNTWGADISSTVNQF
jgi:hypothetical protein